MAESTSLREQIVKGLQREFERRGRGSIAAAQRQMGVNRNYFKDWRSGRNKIDIDRLEEMLQVLEVSPAAFFRTLFEDDPGLIGEAPPGCRSFDRRMEKRDRV